MVGAAEESGVPEIKHVTEEAVAMEDPARGCGEESGLRRGPARQWHGSGSADVAMADLAATCAYHQCINMNSI